MSATGLDEVLPALADLFVDAVNGDTGLGFVAPLDQETSRGYWLSLRRELYADVRVLLVASVGGRIVGSGQLALAGSANARHRAELHKLFVDSRLRGRGIGRALVTALHDEARRRGRHLILLSTRAGEAGERLYRIMGYKDVGIVPGYSVTADGSRAEALLMYHELPAQDGKR